MSIYFTDLTNITDKHIEKIEKEYKVNDYAIGDGCYNLMSELRGEIYKRLIEEFNDMIDFEEKHSVGELNAHDVKESFRCLINDL